MPRPGVDLWVLASVSPNVTVHFWNANDINGATILEIDDEDEFFRGFKLTPDLYALGGWELTLARRVGFALFDSGAVQPEVFVRFLIHAHSDTDYYFGGVLQKRNQVVVARDEQGEEIFTFGGPGPKAYMDRYRLGIEQLTGTGFNIDLENGVWRWNETATAGRVLNRVIAEDGAQDDPSLPDLTKTFGDVNDSDGNPWSNDVAGVGEYEIPIGQSLLTTIFDLEDLSDLFTVINLGSVGSPLYQLEAFEAYGDDVTGTSPGAGVGLLREGLNIANDSLTVEGVGIRKCTHVIVEGKDGAWAIAVRPTWSSGDFVKWGKIDYTRSSNENILERAGLRWLRRQDNGDKQLTVEIAPGASEATGFYFPGPGEVLWPGNTITLDTAEDGSTHTPLDFNNEDELLTGLDLTLGPAGDTATADKKAKSWDIKVRLNWERAGFAGAPDQTSASTSPGRGTQLCAALACDDINVAALPSVATVNGDAEDTGGGQWTGGAYTTAKFHGGIRGYQDAAVATGDLLYTYSGTFAAGVRYVFDFWRRITIDHDRTTVTVGDVGAGDIEVRQWIGVAGADPVNLWLETAVGADGATWNRGRICWTPSGTRTSVTFRMVSAAFTVGDHAIDDLTAYETTPSDELVGNDPRAARCDHNHLVEAFATGEIDTDLVLTPDGNGGVEWSAGIGFGLPWVNVLDHGADPTGVADSLAAFNAALETRTERSAAVIVPPGTYRMSGPLILGNSTVILGVGSNAEFQTNGMDTLTYRPHSVLYFDNDTDGIISPNDAAVTYRCHHPVLQNLSIRGGGSAEGNRGVWFRDNVLSSVSIQRVGLGEVRDCFIEDWATAVDFDGTADSCKLIGGEITRCAAGFIGGQSEDVVERVSFWELDPGPAISISGDRGQVVGNEITPLVGSGVELASTATFNRIIGNLFSLITGTAIDVDGDDNVIVANSASHSISDYYNDTGTDNLWGLNAPTGQFPITEAGGGSLDDLTDVTITSALDLNSLIYDDTTNQWINTAAFWRPVMDGAGAVITDGGTGEAIMAFQ